LFHEQKEYVGCYGLFQAHRSQLYGFSFSPASSPKPDN
jgi:hypothetical protein